MNMENRFETLFSIVRNQGESLDAQRERCDILSSRIDDAVQRISKIEDDLWRKTDDVRNDLERQVDSVKSDLRNLEHKVDYG